MVTAETYPMRLFPSKPMQSRFRLKKQTLLTCSYSCTEKFFCLLYYPGMRCYNTLLSDFRHMICQVVAYGRLKTKEYFKLLALEVVAVAYERWSLTRGSKYSDLTGKFLVFWKLVAEERWSLTRGGRNRRFDCIRLVE